MRIPPYSRILLLILVAIAAPASAQEPPQALTQFLRGAIGLDATQLALVERGEAVVKVMETQNPRDVAIFGIITGLLLSVAAIALFVGGVGVMNIMLVGVTERTREIGIRMAIGAKRADIRAQFLVEAVTLTLDGGLLGILLALGGIYALEKTLGWTMRLSIEAVVVALGTSVAIGMVFGFWPALRAAQLDPIEALRHE